LRFSTPVTLPTDSTLSIPPTSPRAACSRTLVDAEFDIPGKSAGDPKLTSFDVAGPPATGAVLYSQNQGQPVRRDAVVAVKDHSIVHLDREGHVSPASVQGNPVVPIQLASGRHSTYVLYVNPQGGLYFEPLE
jgi:hypothetical protein